MYAWNGVRSIEVEKDDFEKVVAIGVSLSSELDGRMESFRSEMATGMER